MCNHCTKSVITLHGVLPLQHRHQVGALALPLHGIKQLAVGPCLFQLGNAGALEIAVVDDTHRLHIVHPDDAGLDGFPAQVSGGPDTVVSGEDLIFAVDGVALDAVPGPDDDGVHQAAGLQRCFQLGVGFLVQLAEGVLGAGGQLLQWQLHGVVLVWLLLRQLAEQRGICPLFGGLLRPLLTLPIHLGIVKHGDLAHIPLGIWIGAFAVFQHNGFLL